MAIRNPRGHEFGLQETPDQCLDHISLAGEDDGVKEEILESFFEF